MITKPIRNFNNANANLSKRFANSQRVRNIAAASGKRALITLSGDVMLKKGK